MVKKTWKKIKRHLKEVTKIKTDPHDIALGFAIGTFIAIFPTLGLAPFIGFILILIFKKISKLSLFSALAIWNPFMLIPIYTLGHNIGNHFLSDDPIITFKNIFFNNVFLTSRKILLGNTIIAIFFSLAGYLLVYYIAYKYQKKNEDKNTSHKNIIK
jgi:uncharacterized protein (DUF2062 family)